jgi:acyl carrier protein
LLCREVQEEPGNQRGRRGSMDLVERVNAIVAEQLGVEKESLVPEANLLDDLGADSLDVVELVMAIEEEFGIEVPDEDAENIRTLGDITSYIEARVETAA